MDGEGLSATSPEVQHDDLMEQGNKNPGAFKKYSDGFLNECKRGDRIEFKRGLYCHWGLYTSNGNVVHFTGSFKPEQSEKGQKADAQTEKSEKGQEAGTLFDLEYKPGDDTDDDEGFLEDSEGDICDEAAKEERMTEGQAADNEENANFTLSDDVVEESVEAAPDKQTQPESFGKKVKRKFEAALPSSSSSSDLLLGKLKGNVLMEKVKKVAGDSEVRVNNRRDKIWDPQSGEAITVQATDWLHAEVRYSLASFNCKHFVNMARYGKKELVEKAMRRKVEDN